MNPLVRHAKAALRPRSERRKRAAADAVIVSFPKSGRTWLRLMIGRTLCNAYGLPEDRMLEPLWLTRAAGLLPTTFCHDGGSNLEARHVERLSRDKSDYRDKRVLLLVRDPRDVVTSCYHQASSRRRLFRGSLSDFVRHPRYGIRKLLTWYRIWEECRSVPRAFRAVRYEDLRADPVAGLTETLAFLGATDIEAKCIEEAVEYARFENMRRLEQTGAFASGVLRPGEGGGESALKTRRGVVGGHRDELSAEDLAYCNRAIAELGVPSFVALADPD